MLNAGAANRRTHCKTIHTDGYPGYNKVSNVTIVGCWAHARRKFHEAFKAIKDHTSKTSLVSEEGTNYCNKLFEIDRKLANLKD